MSSPFSQNTGQAYDQIDSMSRAKNTLRLLGTHWNSKFPNDDEAMQYIERLFNKDQVDFVYHNAKNNTDENLFHSLAAYRRADLIKRVAQRYDPEGRYINQYAGPSKGTPMLVALKRTRSKNQLPQLKETLLVIIQLGGLVTEDVHNCIDSFTNKKSKVILFTKREATQLKNELTKAYKAYLKSHSTHPRRHQSNSR